MKIIKSKDSLLILILIIFHLVGLVGMSFPKYRSEILFLSSVNLWISFGVLILSRSNKFFHFILFGVLCFILGITFEIIGVKTSLLFGEYYYGKPLGSKIYQIPIVIGLNWIMLPVCTGNLLHKLKWAIGFKTIAASLLIVFLDFLIEPIAVKNGYWYWKNGNIPAYNYVCWFILFLPILFLYFKSKLSEHNKVTNSLYIIMLLFFGILNII